MQLEVFKAVISQRFNRLADEKIQGLWELMNPAKKNVLQGLSSTIGQLSLTMSLSDIAHMPTNTDMSNEEVAFRVYDEKVVR